MIDPVRLDSELARIIEILDPAELVPVIIYTSGPDALALVRAKLKKKQIRSSLDRLNALSAWVAVGRLRSFMESDLVIGLEVAQPVEVKHATC
ncbi:MAG: hypothetical protein OXH46_04855 [Gemmatimonadetes bacterium]|nr:hypothetical protein [Gemmatimonadota bacterium]